MSSPTPHLRLALFDIDGTLVASRDAIGAAAFRAGIKAGFGFEGAPSEVPHVGFTDYQALFALGRHHGLDDARIRAAIPLVLEIKDAQLLAAVGTSPADHPMTPTKGALKLAAALRAAGVVLGLATGNTAEASRLKLARAGFRPSDFQVGGYGHNPGERAGLVRIAMAEAHGFLPDLTPGQVVMIGDTPADVAAGRSVGARTLAVYSDWADPGDLVAAAPDRLVSSLTPTPALLAWLLGRRARPIDEHRPVPRLG
jgi:phosphoglycolate phosphatase-like HAD superfamily hydrolase